MKISFLFKIYLIFLLQFFILNISISPCICDTFKTKEAKYYISLINGDIQCLLCPRECVIPKGQKGNCRTRKNINGKLVSIVYANLCSIHIDPIEKKPLFHFLPDSKSLSIATPGCNLRCIFCQNWSISQIEPEDIECVKLNPEEVVNLAIEKGCPTISYTYSEPTAFYEYVYDTSLLAHKKGIKNLLITSGYINPEPLKELSKVIDAANVDLKGFSNQVYRKMALAKLEPVLTTLKILKESKVWIEVGYLVIPTINDSPEEIRNMTRWIVTNLGPDVPLHFLRFFPQHKLSNLPPTPIQTLENAYDIAKSEGLNYVYIGNLPGHKANNTYCPKCKKPIIIRKGYFIEQNNIKEGRCVYCGNKIAGVWK